MSEHAATHDEVHGATTALFVKVWIGLVAITFFEVFLAYMHLPAVTMLLLLLGFSVIKAGLIMAYFMHLRYEKLSLVLLLIPALLFCIGMMTVVFPDSLRLLHLRVN
jgi:cytochrome c oxidase subunit IV